MTASPEDPRPRRRSTSSRSARSTTEPVREVCPYLVAAEGGWRSVQPVREHRCTATSPASQLALSKQRELCLQPAHFGCATYQAAREVVADGHGAQADGGLWPETRGAVLSLEPAGRVRSGPMLTGRGTGQAVLVGLMVVAFLVLVIARVAPAAGGPDASVNAGIAGSPSPAVAASPVPTETSSASAAASPSAIPAGSEAPSASLAASDVPASAAPSGVPASAEPSAAASASAASTTYRVKRGDTLSGIAAQYGTTVRALMAANGITNATMIHPGQVLVIPD